MLIHTCIVGCQFDENCDLCLSLFWYSTYIYSGVNKRNHRLVLAFAGRPIDICHKHNTFGPLEKIWFQGDLNECNYISVTAPR